ncbi:MAG TPA: VOC family protein [Verrucomicrobiae bacterium]|nr:VOC family protein [Verrucomicrobiae bacterium]
MSKKVQPIPEGFHTLTPYLIVADADKELEFIKSAFDGQVIHLSRAADGTISHVTLKVGDSMLMMGQGSKIHPPAASMLYMYVEDTDAVYQRALECGAKSEREPADQIYGDRTGGVVSATGIHWWFGTRIEEVSEEEMEKRTKAMMAKHGG